MKGGIAVQSSKLKKLKKALVLSSVYMLLSAVLLLSISTAKYTDSHLAYTSYGAASFNSVILGDCTDGTIHAFGRTLCADQCRPGMKYSDVEEENTSKSIPFSIANGTTAENVSETSVSYTIRLRTTRNLPLRFTLAGLTGTGDSATTTLYTAGDPVVVEDTESVDDGPEKLVWYEWTFCTQPAEEGAAQEAVFSLKGGAMAINNHQLIVEWPITEKAEGETPDNSSVYMKELDLIEVLVTVSSKNSLDEEHTEFEIPASELYGKGIIILDPSILDPSIAPDTQDEAYPYHYSYPVDLRSFHAPEEGVETKVYDFTVSNGVGIGKTQISRYTDYVIELKVPYTAADTNQNAIATMGFGYELSMYDSAADVYTSAAKDVGELRLYNEEVNSSDYGTYTVVSDPSDEDLAKWTKEESPVRLYRIYSFTANGGTPFRLINKMADNEGNFADRAASRDFRLALTGAEGLTTATAFENKLEITVKAVPVDPEVNPSEEETAADEGDGTEGGTEPDPAAGGGGE